MGNCSNISNTQAVSLTAGTLTSGFCHTSLQTTYEEFIARTTAQLSQSVAGFVAGDDTPDAGDQDKLWFKQNGSNCYAPLGWHFYNATSSAVDKWQIVRSEVPVGSISMWYTATAPDNWLFCDGTTFTATDYPTLNTVLGGNTLPDLKGRMPIGVGQQSNTKWDESAFTYTSNGTDFSVADSGGTEEHRLIQTELPKHKHRISKATAFGGSYAQGGTRDSGGPAEEFTTQELYDSSNQEITEDQPHNNLPPYLALNFIICAK